MVHSSREGEISSPATLTMQTAIPSQTKPLLALLSRTIIRQNAVILFHLRIAISVCKTAERSSPAIPFLLLAHSCVRIDDRRSTNVHAS